MSKITRRTTTTGLFPLPDEAKETLKEQKGRQKDDLIDGSEGGEINASYADARRTVIGWQNDVGLDRIVEGQVRWDDMLAHPLAVHENVKTGGLRRYYDNNNFYREVTIEGPLTPDGDIARDLEAASEHVPADRLQAIIPGPISLTDLASDEYYGGEEALLEGITSFLREEIAAYPSVETVLLLEPSITSTRLSVPSDTAIDAISEVVNSSATAGIDEIIVHTYWGALDAGTYRGLLDIDRLGVGFDFVTARDASLSLIEDYGAPPLTGLGVVDAHNTRVESPDAISSEVETVSSISSEIERVFLSFNAEGFYLPTNRFREKLDVLARACHGVEVDA